MRATERKRREIDPPYYYSYSIWKIVMVLTSLMIACFNVRKTVKEISSMKNNFIRCLHTFTLILRLGVLLKALYVIALGHTSSMCLITLNETIKWSIIYNWGLLVNVTFDKHLITSTMITINGISLTIEWHVPHTSLKGYRNVTTRKCYVFDNVFKIIFKII